MTAKTIYLARRNPATTYEEFVENWRQHAVLSGSFPDVGARFDSVVQCKRVTEPLADSLALTQDFDGANLLGLKSLFDAVDVYNQEGIPTLRQDERRVFSDYVSESSLTGVEHILLDGERGQVVLLTLVRRRPGTDLRTFFLAWTGDHAKRLADTEGYRTRVRRHTQTLIVLPTPPGWGYDGVGELWFDDVASAARFLEETGDLAAGPELGGGLTTLLELSHVWVRRPPRRPDDPTTTSGDSR
ncbi:MAG TPA: EthD domain-containing protein [Nocardioides sp.]|uniref:EthD domain-containing protein n=1 Tax=Nocardioides sp. TaxID=35761 RepID=UPI002E36DB8E|nr:EthD domain-containing protein [Nocardioides sp.]HEX3929686.1 EthD domain-containing protein [Nocardioides sp.]